MLCQDMMSLNVRAEPITEHKANLPEQIKNIDINAR